jgi:regulatory protein
MAPRRADDPGAVPPEDEQDAPGDPESVARAICLRLLSQRARTRAELAEALRRRGVPDEAADAVLTRYVEVGLIDDESLAHNVALAQHQERGLAARAVAVKLRRRGLPERVVESALAQIGQDSEREAARRLVARKLPALRGLPEQAQVRRLVGMLARRGYSSGVAGDVVREVLADSIGGDVADSLVAE